MTKNPVQNLRPHQSSLVFAALAAIAAWYLPVLHYLMLPLQYLNTHAHELCHALVATATGGEVAYIQVSANGNGVTPVAGGSILLEGSAGYVGAAVIGSSMIFFGRTPQRAKTVLLTLGAMLTFSMILWVRSDSIGILSGLFWIATLFAMAFRLKSGWVLFAAQFIGVEQCLTSLQALGDLLKLSVDKAVRSDAYVLSEATHIPALVWAVAWSFISVVLVFVALRSTWKQRA